MSVPKDIGIVDTMIGFPADDFAMYDFIREQLKDPSAKFEFPVEYMFKQVPKELYGSSKDPVTLTLNEMDKHGVEIGLIGVGGEVSRKALTEHPDRFVGQGSVDPNTGMEGIREMVRQYEAFGVSSFGAFNAGFNPQVGINDAKMYPIYAKCVELDVPIFSCVGVPGPRFPMWPQKVELIDQVMYDFPELVFVTRHGCEPWEDLAIKLMLKWPNLYYSTTAFAPKFYPKSIIDYANSRGSHKIIYGGYFPMGLSLDRIMDDMQGLALNDDVWPKFLRDNARQVLKLT
ncbi:MAG: amidohydrolase family protein [Gammaproteobacteria bacterium]|jgi:predicted TIM-barrel fold metal-dependent hydrolase|nr:amidohydrolase family protein [Gammaproteobacteria bacterium]MDC6450145.1 amidohydrolase family protein [Pseudomonadales bacterium]|tara:strand:- start:63 stop:923 length:861 start_codon:yes stop_codon:yes gene_type:complete